MTFTALPTSPAIIEEVSIEVVVFPMEQGTEYNTHGTHYTHYFLIDALSSSTHEVPLPKVTLFDGLGRDLPRYLKSSRLIFGNIPLALLFL